MNFNLNILIIIIIILIPLGLGIQKLTNFFITKKKREKVRLLLNQEPNKRIMYSPSRTLKAMNVLMSPKYFANVFYKKYVKVSRYNINEKISLKKYLNMETSDMESNYFFNMIKNKMANNFFVRERIPNKYWNNFIFPEIGNFLDKENIQGYPKNILNIEIIFVGDSIHLPTQYFKNDVFICSLKGVADIKHVAPSIINELDPYTCFTFTRKRIEDLETTIGQNELREGDYIYIPNGTGLDISFRNSFPSQIIFIIEFDNFQKSDKLDDEINIIKLEQIQLRKIPRKVYPKDLQPDELEILWNRKLITGTIWEKNQIIKNIL